MLSTSYGKTPSFVYLDKSGTFYCYGCRTGYNVIDFHMKYNGFKDVHETIEDLFLKDQIGYNVLLSRFSYIKSMYSALKIGGRFPLNLNLDFI